MNQNKIAWVLITGLLVIAGIDSVWADVQQDTSKGTVSVTGTSSENVPPDTAEIVLAVENTALSVTQAASRNKKVSEKVITALKNYVSKEKEEEIKTSSYSVQPVYEYDRSRQTNNLVGYKVANEITVKIREIDRAGTIIDSAMQEGVNRVQRISFTLADDRVHCASLLEEASRQAKSEAEIVARSLSVKILGIKNVSAACGSDRPVPVYRLNMAQEEASFAKASTPVEAGTIALRSTVQAEFHIEN